MTGNCDSVQCDGDAITCALLKTQQKRDCEDHDEKQREAALGKSILDGSDPQKADLPSPDKAQEIDVSKDIKADGWGGGGGACAQDKTVALMGQSIVMPLSSVCEYLLPLRFCIMLIASIISFKMLTGAVLRE